MSMYEVNISTLDRSMTRKEFRLLRQDQRLRYRIVGFQRIAQPEIADALWKNYYEATPRWFFEMHPRSLTPARKLRSNDYPVWVMIKCNLCYVPHSWPHRTKNP